MKKSVKKMVVQYSEDEVYRKNGEGEPLFPLAVFRKLLTQEHPEWYSLFSGNIMRKHYNVVEAIGLPMLVVHDPMALLSSSLVIEFVPFVEKSKTRSTKKKPESSKS